MLNQYFHDDSITASPACSLSCCSLVSKLPPMWIFFIFHVRRVSWWAIPWHSLTTSPLLRLPAGLERRPLSLSIWQRSLSVVYIVMGKFFAFISLRVREDRSWLENLVVVIGGSGLKPVRSENQICVCVADEAITTLFSQLIEFRFPFTAD